MSNITTYKTGLSTPFCMRSLALACDKYALSPKEEILILSRLLSAALNYSREFTKYLRDCPDSPLMECGRLMFRSKRSAFIRNSKLTEEDRMKCREKTLFFARLLHSQASRFAQETGDDVSGLNHMLSLPSALIKSFDTVKNRHLDNGMPFIRFVNPYVAVNIAAAVDFDVSCDIARAEEDCGYDDLTRRLAFVHEKLERVREAYPVNNTPLTAEPALNDYVLEALIAEHTRMNAIARDIPKTEDATTMEVSLFAYETMCSYLEPFVQEEHQYTQAGPKENILTISGWIGAVEKTRAKRTWREERQKAHPELYLPRNDL